MFLRFIGRPAPAIASLTFMVAGCGGTSVTMPADDGDAADAPTSTDAGAPLDVGATDATTPVDAGATDTGAKDTGISDSGVPDTGALATTTAGVECGYSYSGFNSTPSVNATSTVTWTCTATTRTVTGNGLPDHAVGTFPNSNCPNTISAQSVSATMTLTPVNTGKSTNLGIGGVGYAMNGVKFDPGTAGTCSVSSTTTTCSLIGDTGAWNIEALGQSSFNFGVDSNNAHVQPTGAYHYHGMPEGTLTLLGKGMAPTLVGYALDGFPVYARYGYSKAMDATSAVKVITASYQLKATADAGRPSTTTYPMGAFTQDYEYVAGSGDLDECNGRIDVTPEFPAGIYHYYITDTYPFIQRCTMGTSSAMTGPGGDAGMPGGDGGGPGMGASCSSSSPCSSASDVCCPSGYPCAGTCVPDCTKGGACPSGLTCDTSLGICK